MAKGIIQNSELKKILLDLEKKRGFDFTGLSAGMVERRMSNRLHSIQISKYSDYLNYLESHPEEYDELIDTLTINVSGFFRDAICFEYLSHVLIPSMLEDKLAAGNKELRVWSAGCSTGEEAYTLAIILVECIEKTKHDINLNIFATDINDRYLSVARKGVYTLSSMEELKVGLLGKYFVYHPDKTYSLAPAIKKIVHFSAYDLLDKKTGVPRESIFGNFDIIICRNVLIYYNKEKQSVIFNKILRALQPGGLMVLGQAEMPDDKTANAVKEESRICKIYTKK
ncbi:MAG TPA: protein-glutamate O-methyltransferase CheR [Bacteroidales bacterium]|nr:protein-glutamate O-methyltransferase CheR [Bacteroidales bacterium]